MPSSRTSRRTDGYVGSNWSQWTSSESRWLQTESRWLQTESRWLQTESRWLQNRVPLAANPAIDYRTRAHFSIKGSRCLFSGIKRFKVPGFRNPTAHEHTSRSKLQGACFRESKG